MTHSTLNSKHSFCDLISYSSPSHCQSSHVDFPENIKFVFLIYLLFLCLEYSFSLDSFVNFISFRFFSEYHLNGPSLATVFKNAALFTYTHSILFIPFFCFISFHNLLSNYYLLSICCSCKDSNFCLLLCP